MDNTTLTAEEVAAIQARADAATPGPWEWWSGNPWHAEAPNHPLRDGNPPVVFWTANMNYGICHLPAWLESAKANTDFIASARTDIPRLCASHAALLAKTEHLGSQADKAISIVIRLIHHNSPEEWKRLCSEAGELVRTWGRKIP